MSENFSISISDTYHYHGSVVFGLTIQSDAPFPLVVGCSLRTEGGKIIDIPANRITEGGLAIWGIEATADCARGGNPHYGCDWCGHVIFALYRDETFSERLTDTGWIPWTAPWLIGGSTAGLDIQDEEIESKYGYRKHVLVPF